MSSDYFESALISLSKPQEKDRLYKILVAIRKDVEWPAKKENIDKLRDQGCLKQLVLCLQQHHTNILNITLSILGNCCMERTCARDAVIKYNFLPHISNALKRYKQDSIRGRIFRIIGNMCQHWDRLANTIIEKEPQLQLVVRIVEFLKSVADMDGESWQSFVKKELSENKPSESTIVMAIRALRELANGDTVVPLIKDLGVLKAVGMILVKFTPHWENTKQHVEVLNVVLRLLQIYSRYHCEYSVAELHNTDIGNATEHLGKLLYLNPYQVVKITMNFKKMSHRNSELPVVEIYRRLIERLTNPASFMRGREDLLYREYLKCLCFLIQHPANKEQLRNEGLIRVLLEILEGCKAATDIGLKNYFLVISTLRLCMYDEASLAEMLKYGIVKALLAKLEWLFPHNKIDTSHKYAFRKYNTHWSRKRRRIIEGPCFMHQISLDSTPCISSPGILTTMAPDFHQARSASPSSDISFSSGPSFSPPASPAWSDGTVHSEDSKSDSDDYSPVCSDAEAEHPTAEELPDGFTQGSSPYEDEVDEQTCMAEPVGMPDNGTSAFKKQLSNEIVKLTKLLVKIRPVNVDLCSSELMTKLLMFLLPSNKYICPVDTLSIIHLIAETHEYLLALMQTDFVLAAHKFSTMQHGIGCRLCTELHTIGQDILLKFTMLVEDGSGKGDIAYQLYRANLPIKQKLVSAIPFVTNNKLTLKKLMVNCGGLGVLMQLFRQSSDMQEKCISGLCLLAMKLGIKNPACCEDKADKCVRLPINVQHYRLEKNCSTVVQFKLDDGSCVQADRDFLSQKSEYFNRLLSGEFKESWEEEIHLSGVPNKTLKFLLMLLQYDVNSKEIHKLDADLDVLLDAIVLMDRYLMEDLCGCVTMSVQYFRFLPTTIPTIYQWSLESGTNILRVETVAYALVATMNESERYNMFQSLLQLGYSEHLADDVQALLTRFLNMLQKD